MNNSPLRSPCDTVCGLVYFGRMVDQIRADVDGNLTPQYHANFRKGLDEQCVHFLGVSYNQVIHYVKEGVSDEAILESCFGTGHRPSAAEIYIWNEFMLKRGWHDDTSLTLKQLKREQGLTARSEIETIFQLIDAIEGRAVHASRYDGSCLEQISLVVGGRHRSTLSSRSHVNGFHYPAADRSFMSAIAETESAPQSANAVMQWKSVSQSESQ